jgi:hypothetical protein
MAYNAITERLIVTKRVLFPSKASVIDCARPLCRLYLYVVYDRMPSPLLQHRLSSAGIQFVVE